jgi:DNA-binding MarR family transcriptional regulator
MTEMRTPEVESLLQQAGADGRVIDAVKRVDALLQNWRRRVVKRELSQVAIQDLGLALDLAQLDVLAAIEAPVHEFGATEGEETMVSTVATRIGIDPSRASRLIAELVDSGYAERVASQADSRRTLIRLTDKGRAVTGAVRAYRFLLMGDFFAEWSAEDLARFLPLLERFSHWSEDVEARRGSMMAQIAVLAGHVAEAGAAETGAETTAAV